MVTVKQVDAEPKKHDGAEIVAVRTYNNKYRNLTVLVQSFQCPHRHCPDSTWS